MIYTVIPAVIVDVNTILWYKKFYTSYHNLNYKNYLYAKYTKFFTEMYSSNRRFALTSVKA